jgi:hypothetical protein
MGEGGDERVLQLRPFMRDPSPLVQADEGFSLGGLDMNCNEQSVAQEYIRDRMGSHLEFNMRSDGLVHGGPQAAFAAGYLRDEGHFNLHSDPHNRDHIKW